MKKITNTLFGASLLLAAVLGTGSCRKPSGEGTGVRFSARTFSSPLTKTEYSGVVDEDTNIERINWVSGDQITIACANCTPTSADYRVTGTITPQGAISTVNALTPVSGNGLQWGTGSHTFYAVYPAGDATELQVTGVARATIPAFQGGTDTDTDPDPDTGVTTMAPDMNNAFMYASQTASPGNNVELTFNPMFTAFQFTVGGDGTSGDVTLSQVELSSTTCALSGRFTLNIGSTTYDIPSVVVTEDENANNKITYTFPLGTTINKNKQVRFTLFVQPRSNVDGKTDKITDLTIRFTLLDGAKRALKLKYDADHGGAFVDFPGGKKINITGLTLPTQLKSWSFTVLDVENWDDDSPDILYGSPVVVEPGEGWIAETFAPVDVNNLREDQRFYLGPFTVSSSGAKVAFSRGNLQYNKNTGIWSFMDHQYTTVEALNQNVGTNYANQDVVSLFGWGTSGHEFSSGYGTAYQPWSSSIIYTDYGPKGNHSLTGEYADGDWGVNMGSGWRTLSLNEWTYLLETRGGEDYPRYCKATVNGVTGLVIFPDEFVDLSIYFNINDVNTRNAAFTSNTWDGYAWTMMEFAGCVFLPAAGYRDGTSVYNVGSEGNYWSSDHAGGSLAYSMIFNSSKNALINRSRHDGRSVRLVQDL